MTNRPTAETGDVLICHGRATAEIDSAGAPTCGCGLSMTRNPHPDCGKPVTLLETGPVWACMPCTFKRLHACWGRVIKAERALSDIRKLATP